MTVQIVTHISIQIHFSIKLKLDSNFHNIVSYLVFGSSGLDRCWYLEFTKLIIKSSYTCGSNIQKLSMQVKKTIMYTMNLQN